MSVIAEIGLPADEFALGRVVEHSLASSIELESLVPTGTRAVPYLWVYDADFEAFEAALETAEEVEEVTAIDAYEDRVLYTVVWAGVEDCIFRLVSDVDAYVLNAHGAGGSWEFELRFPDRQAMSRFQADCRDRDVAFDVFRVYNPGKPDLGPWYGLTEPQREALVLAVERGYYEIPRDCTTAELAEQLGISDQAVTERLRRAIVTLSDNTVLSSSGQ